MPTIYHVQLNCKEDDGVLHKVYPYTVADDVTFATNNENLPAGATTLEDILANLGTLAFQSSLNLPVASTSAAGVTILSHATNNVTDAAKSVSATSYALGMVNAGAVHTTGDESIGGVKTFTNDTIFGNFKLVSEVDSSGNKTLRVQTVASA